MITDKEVTQAIEERKQELNRLKLVKELGKFSSYKEVFDFIPSSVWNINSRTKEIKEIFEDDLQKHTCERTDNGAAVNIKLNLSVFNPILGINILKVWSNVGDTILDPFAGRDRALITNYMDRNYIGYEISPITFQNLKNKTKKWKYINNNYNIQLFNNDGTILNNTEDNSCDFIFSCPPYWNKEKYESVLGQISDIKTETEWRKKINQCAISLYSKLRKNKFCAFVIADIRIKGELIPLHSHFIEEFRNVGWKLKDTIINKINPMNCSGINGFLRNKIMWKTHEYIIVFQK